MLIIPAIDLKDGNVVRLYQGREQEVKIYSRNPVVVARHWQKQGAKLIHVVDLDGAFSGEPKNFPVLKEIIESVRVPIEFGGGIRDKGAIRKALYLGVERVVLGTRAVEDMNFLHEVLGEFPEKIIVSIDTREGMVLTQGWQNDQVSLAADVFALRLKEMGLEEIIYTDVLKDGTLRGPNLESLSALLEKTGLGIIASGGISSLEDIAQLKKLEKKGLSGVIIGKALYEKKFTLKEALRFV
jgi:phosphoribosylformimino-5-aminoimidazole carboxamide ribotide isomerase